VSVAGLWGVTKNITKHPRRGKGNSKKARTRKGAVPAVGVDERRDFKSSFFKRGKEQKGCGTRYKGETKKILLAKGGKERGE